MQEQGRKRKQGGKRKPPEQEYDVWLVEGSPDRPKPRVRRWRVEGQKKLPKPRSPRSRVTQGKKRTSRGSPRGSQSQVEREEDRPSRGSTEPKSSKKRERSGRPRTDAGTRQWLSVPDIADSVESNSGDGLRQGRASQPGSRSKRPRRAQSKSGRPPTVSKAKLPRGRLDLNAATFEQLRTLELSVTQSARLIAARDTRGGFESINELDGLYGFPQAIRAMLKERGKVVGEKPRQSRSSESSRSENGR